MINFLNIRKHKTFSFFFLFFGDKQTIKTEQVILNKTEITYDITTEITEIVDKKDSIKTIETNKTKEKRKIYVYFFLIFLLGNIAHTFYHLQDKSLDFHTRFIINKFFLKEKIQLFLGILFTIFFFIFRFFYIKNYDIPLHLSFLFFLICLPNIFLYIFPLTFWISFLSLPVHFFPICFNFCSTCLLKKEVKIKIFEKNNLRTKNQVTVEEKIKSTKLAKLLLIIGMFSLLGDFFILKNKKNIINKFLFFFVPNVFLLFVLIFINFFPNYYCGMYSHFFFHHKISLLDENNKNLNLDGVSSLVPKNYVKPENPRYETIVIKDLNREQIKILPIEKQPVDKENSAFLVLDPQKMYRGLKTFPVCLIYFKKQFYLAKGYSKSL